MNANELDLGDVERNFESLFIDSIVLLEMAQKRENILINETFSRGSAICSLLLPEVVSNICIETLCLEKSIHNEIDKLSNLGKMDYYLRITTKDRKIDRGIRQIQEYQELKYLRDCYVHPQKIKMIWTRESDTLASGESEKTQCLGISKNMNLWNDETALIIMKTTHRFLSYFFKECCHFTKEMVSVLLFSQDEVPTKDGLIIPYYERRMKSILKTWDIDISYFKVGWRTK